MGIINKAWELQHKIEKRMQELPEPTFEGYLYCVSFLFILTGFGLLIYCFLFRINIAQTQVMSSPLFYLPTGILFIFCYIGVKIHNKNKKS